MNVHKTYHYLKVFNIESECAYVFKEWAFRSLVRLNLFRSFIIAQTQCPLTKNFNHHILGKCHVSTLIK